MDEQRYGALLAEARPRIIETSEEHDRMLAFAESLMEKGDALGEEEQQLLALVVLLIEAYEIHFANEDEDEGETEPPPAPHVTLERLMFSHGLAVDDVAHVFGNPHVAREVLEGKRDISRRQAKELGKFFRVPAKLFGIRE
jgi:HTH-type transcriptional regulator / antitoxin HigA